MTRPRTRVLPLVLPVAALTTAGAVLLGHTAATTGSGGTGVHIAALDPPSPGQPPAGASQLAREDGALASGVPGLADGSASGRLHGGTEPGASTAIRVLLSPQLTADGSPEGPAAEHRTAVPLQRAPAQRVPAPRGPSVVELGATPRGSTTAPVPPVPSTAPVQGPVVFEPPSYAAVGVLPLPRPAEVLRPVPAPPPPGPVPPPDAGDVPAGPPTASPGDAPTLEQPAPGPESVPSPDEPAAPPVPAEPPPAAVLPEAPQPGADGVDVPVAVEEPAGESAVEPEPGPAVEPEPTAQPEPEPAPELSLERRVAPAPEASAPTLPEAPAEADDDAGTPGEAATAEGAPQPESGSLELVPSDG